MTGYHAVPQPPDGLVIETRSLAPAITAFTLAGTTDEYSARRLRERMIDEIDAGSVHLVVETDEVAFLDSTGLGVLVGIRDRLHERSGLLYLAPPGACIEKILRITGLVNVLRTAASTDAAIEAIAAAANGEPRQGTP